MTFRLYATWIDRLVMANSAGRWSGAAGGEPPVDAHPVPWASRRRQIIRGHCHLIVRNSSERWSVGLLSGRRFQQGAPEAQVLEALAEDGWVLVAKAESFKGTATYLFRHV